MAITYRTDDPPKEYNPNDTSWMEDAGTPQEKPEPAKMKGSFYTGVLEGSTKITDPVMAQLQSEGKAQFTYGDLMRQKYGARADELMQRLNELRAQNKLAPTQWDRSIPVARGGSSPFGMTGDRATGIKVGSKFDFTQPDSFAALLSHETAHLQDPTPMSARLPHGFETSHRSDPKSLREANAFLLGDNLAAYNMTQPDDKKFHPALYKNPETGEYDFDTGMKEFMKIMRSNPNLFPDWEGGGNRPGLEGTLDSDSASGKAFRKAAQSIGGNIMSRGNRYEIQSETA